MPLKESTSKQAFSENVSAEMKTRPQKQAVAIAYAVKRRAAGKRGIVSSAMKGKK